MLVSASSAVMVMVPVPATLGVPQNSRASVPEQPPESVPVASNTRPVGRVEVV